MGGTCSRRTTPKVAANQLPTTVSHFNDKAEGIPGDKELLRNHPTTWRIPLQIQQDFDTLAAETEKRQEKDDEPGDQRELLNCVVQFGLTGDFICSLRLPRHSTMNDLKRAIAIPSRLPAELQKLMVDEKIPQEHELPLIDGATTISLFKLRLCEADDAGQALTSLCNMGPLRWPSYYAEVNDLAHELSLLRPSWSLAPSSCWLLVRSRTEWLQSLSDCFEILAPSEFSLIEAVYNVFERRCKTEAERCDVDSATEDAPKSRNRHAEKSWRPPRVRILRCDTNAFSPLLSRPEVLTAIASMLEDTCSDKRFVAACLLSRVGGHAAPYADALAKLLLDDLPEIRYYAAFALGSLGGRASRYATVLVRLLCDEYASVRYRALVTLGGIGHKVATHYAEVVKCLMDDNEYCRLAAIRVLKSIGATTDAVSNVVQAWFLEAAEDACRERTNWCAHVPLVMLGRRRRRGVLPYDRRGSNNILLTATRVLTNPGVPLKEIFRGRSPLGKTYLKSDAKDRWHAHLKSHKIAKRWARVAQGALEAKKAHDTSVTWKQDVCDRWLLIQNQKRDLPDQHMLSKSSRQYWRARAILRSSQRQLQVQRALSRRRRRPNDHRCRERCSKGKVLSEFTRTFDLYDVCMWKP